MLINKKNPNLYKSNIIKYFTLEETFTLSLGHFATFNSFEGLSKLLD
jgi:hypothetical protein